MNNKYLQGTIILVIIILGFLYFSKNNNELSKEDLFLKCAEIYKIKRTNFESVRYPDQEKMDLIWSPKTKSCLAYYNSNNNYSEKALKEAQEYKSSYLFEVWDYSNDEVVLSYYSRPSDDCQENKASTYKAYKNSFTYKYNKKLEGEGCFLTLKVDLLTNFQTAMTELGFKKGF